MRMARWMTAVAATVVVLGGCGREGGELREATERRRAEEAAARADTVRDTTPAPVAADTPMERLPAFVLTDTPTVRPEEPAEAPADPDPSAAPAGTEWTAGRREVVRDRAGVATLRAVRLGVNEGFDRMVIEFADGRQPGYLVEYVDRPVRQCGSGDPVQIAGDGWLRIRMRPARGHDDQGRATISDRHRTPRMPLIREMRFTCDFEADTEIVIGVGSPNRFRVFEQTDPARLVVDVQH
jgi:hypothetical protein